jgi:hypothetical protein
LQILKYPKNIGMHRHSSLFLNSIIDKEKLFYINSSS